MKKELTQMNDLCLILDEPEFDDSRYF